ncbi:hypothetical protein TPHA_0B01740 [Tetrapisispora phaffii CBS 4417]|uniref:Sec39 domain-containing protein n=1 Tax=Tetrapisispora phaffii (strain ATCC 24235 / CBS 4417 / NBRC 1672 / NRRL Y-8282 / UCD 70-5) TaxID=1071381 RepID=G8BPB6_TETPH|nr:hypothetical protein TPHA_0B01740 [Tetrapisispora phaffii CBS 4417]CCE61847.1 hypothetical protein TPHA_0B01740 [Tetrapisispora phaffii CBS 4417]
MLENQLYLLATIFASTADVEKLTILKNSFTNSSELLDIICVLWPELDDPILLRNFLTNLELNDLNADENPIDEDNILVSLLETGEDLVPIIEMDVETVSERVSTVKEYINRRLVEVTLDEITSFDDTVSSWLRKRILLCDELNPFNVLFNKKLWKEIKPIDPEFMGWVNGILEPLDFINNSSDIRVQFRIIDFEALTPNNVIELLTKNLLENEYSFNNKNVQQIDCLISYLNYTNSFTLFLEQKFNTNSFLFKKKQNYLVFDAIFTKFNESNVMADKENFQKAALSIIFENSKELMNIISMDELKQLLDAFDQNIETANGINSKILLSYIHLISIFLQDYSLKEVHLISKENEASQLLHYTSMIKAKIMSKGFKTSSSTAVNEILSVITGSASNSEQIVFTHIPPKRQISVLIDLLLELGEFDLLQDLMEEQNSQLEEAGLEKYFWHFFNNASNGLKSRPEMKKAQKTVKLLLEQNEPKFKHLEILLHIADLLSYYSINLGKGVIFKPSNIFDFKNHPSQIISKLLELNDGLYKDKNTTSLMLKELFEGMNLDITGDFFVQEQIRVSEFHIDNALANLDFYFAYHESKELLTKSENKTPWATVFQVCKFSDPNWLDNETPTEILVLQFELSSDLLQSCPTEEMEIVISQWSSLELELLTRDIINDQYSIGNSGDSKREFSQATNLLDGVSNSVTKFISSNLS